MTAPAVASVASATVTSYLPAWATDSASVASIIGLILTVYVAWGMRTIRRRYARKWRIPEIADNLNDASDELLNFLNALNGGNPNHNYARQCIQGISPHVEGAIEHSTDGARKKAKKLKALLSTVLDHIKSNASVRSDDLWECYSTSKEVVVLLQQSLKNDDWK